MQYKFKGGNYLLWLEEIVYAAQNAAILAAEMIALADEEVAQKVEAWKAGLGAKIEKANQDLAEVKYDFKCN